MFANQPGAPLWTVIPFTIALIAIAVETGYRLGRYERSGAKHEKEAAASDLTTPAIGILGLMLAFTFGWAATRFDARGAARVKEAEAMGRLFRLAAYLPAPDRDHVRSLIRDYVDVSVTMSDPAAFEQAFQRREAMHVELWKIAVAAGDANPNSQNISQFVAATNDVLSSHLNRSILAISSRIPPSIMVTVHAILALTMAMIGYRFGLAGSARSPALVPLTISVALVLFLIADLERPFEGILRFRDRALEELQREIRSWP